MNATTHPKPTSTNPTKPFTYGFIGLITAQVIAVFVLASVPPVGKDALIHHLAVPKLYLEHGIFKNLPGIEFSYYPMNLQLLYMIPLYFKNDILPKYIHFAFALATAWFVGRYLTRRINLTYGLFGAYLFLSTPIITKLSTSAYVDLGLIFFSTAAILALLDWLRNGFRLKHLITSGIYCGLALGTKYNGLVVFTFLSLLVVYCYSRYADPTSHRQFRAIGYGLVFILIALSLFSPWMIKDYIQTHNPIFPLYNGLFNPSSHAGQGITKNNHFVIRKIIYHEAWWETALIPLRVFFQGQDGNPKYFDGQLNPFLLLLPLLLFLVKSPERITFNQENKMWWLLAGLILLFVDIQMDMRIRWIAPIVPPLVILSAISLYNIQTASAGTGRHALSPRLLKGCVFILGTAACIPNIYYVYTQYQTIDPIHYLSGQISRDDYIDKFRPEYATIQYANHHLPENAKILFLFIGKRRYYCDRQLTINPRLLQKAVNNSPTAALIPSRLKQKGITHILINYYFFNHWIDRSFDAEHQIQIQELFQKHLQLLFAKAGYGLYAVEGHALTNNQMP